MARSILASALMTRLEQMTDTENDTHLGTAEKYAILSSAVAGTWDMILAAGLGTEYVTPVTFSTTAGTSTVAIATAIPAIAPATSNDFYKVSEMYVVESDGRTRPLPRIPSGEREAWKPPPVSVSIKLYYTPCAPVWTAGTESFDGINGWEEHTLATAAITIKNKKGDDAGPFKAIKRDLESRIQTMANRNAADPPRVVRKNRTSRSRQMYYPYQANVSGWDIRGSNFEFMYRDGLWT